MMGTPSPIADRSLLGLIFTRLKFLACHKLLPRWQSELEYYLYCFCKATAPQILDKRNWTCAEDAELTKLTEKITEYFCMSPQERELFCVRLQEVCQVRNFAVHRVTLHTTKIQKYGRIITGLLGTIIRLGGEDFQQSCNNRLDHFIRTFWDIESNKSIQISPSTTTGTKKVLSVGDLPKSKLKEAHIEQAFASQKLAAQRKANNILQMAEDFQTSKRKRDINRYQNQQDKDKAKSCKAEKAEKASK
ncbi:hypothetical protein BDV19DRAFT_383457 [Aspergillus venezuelensis]